jgi:ATP-binding cassette subfamily F protein uup
VLDEPTNDLDIDTLELLEELLEDYSGTVFLVSHDRTFLDNVVTQVIVAEGEGQWREYVGGYSDWERVRATAQVAPVKTAAKSDAKFAARESALPSTKQQKKLSYKEQRELETLPKLISDLEAEQKTISEQLADPELYKQHPEEVQRLNSRFAEIDDLLMESLEKWEAIEAKAKGLG